MKREIIYPIVAWFAIATIISIVLVSCGTVHCDAYGHNNIENGILSEDEAS